MSNQTSSMPFLHGSMTALITPFTTQKFGSMGHLGDIYNNYIGRIHDSKTIRIDFHAFERMIEWQIAQGTHALVVCGTTGESYALSDREQIQLIKFCVETVDGRVPVIAGTGMNVTGNAIYLTKAAERTGADAALLVTPYYNGPNQSDLINRYFGTIHRNTNQIELIPYTVPGRTGGVDIMPETMLRLTNDYNRIHSVKNASGGAGQTAAYLAVNKDLIVLCGDDPAVMNDLEQGAKGCISVISNVTPRQCAEIHNAWHRGETEVARRISEEIAPLASGLFPPGEKSPKAIKYVANKISNGALGSHRTREPLGDMGEKGVAIVEAAMAQVNPIYAPIERQYSPREWRQRQARFAALRLVA